MVPRGALLWKLQQCLESDERALSVYAQYKADPTFLSDLPKKEQSRIQEVLLLLTQGSESHAEIFQDLIKKIAGTDQDAF